MPSHLLTNFEIRKYCQNEPRFNGVHLRNNLPKIKDGVYVINFDEYMMWHILIASELNIYQKRLKCL